MVTTAITRLDYGNITGVLDRTTRLSNAMAQNVFLCRYDGSRYVARGRNRRNSESSFLVRCWFLALLLVAILWVLHDSRLPNDALLALCSATLLCAGLLLIQQVPSLRPELLSYLFGDLLSIEWSDLPIFAVVIMIALVVLYRSWSAQIQIAIDPDIAMSEGINANWQRLIFMLLLALFTVLALRAVGSLLMGALLVIPALSARLLAHSPKQMVLWAFILAQLGITVGLWSSAALNIATGLSIVLFMALIFAVIFMLQNLIDRHRQANPHF